MVRSSLLTLICVVSGWAATFETAVMPILSNTCRGCHNERTAAGGLDIAPFLSPASFTSWRAQWEEIVAKLRSGEMPPRRIPRPPQEQIDGFISYVEGEFERMDKQAKPEPGRVVARRLNWYEYSNTIRDLPGVEFHAEKDFPTDDSSYGFDTIGSVLSVSPVLTERYLKADSLKPAVLGFLLNGMRKMLPMDATQVRDPGKALEIRNSYVEIACAKAAHSAR